MNLKNLIICATQFEGGSMETALIFFIVQSGKGVPHTKNLCTVNTTRGLSGKCMNLRNYTLCEVREPKKSSPTND
jgi:hypothetical protein